MRRLLLGVVILSACTVTPPADPPPAAVVQPPPLMLLIGSLSIRLVPDGATTTDAVTDVVAEAMVSGGTGTLRLSVDFVAPAGTTFQRSTTEVPAAGEQSLSFSMPVAGTDAARFPGAWSAVLIGPEGRLANAGFQLQESAP